MDIIYGSFRGANNAPIRNQNTSQVKNVPIKEINNMEGVIIFKTDLPSLA